MLVVILPLGMGCFALGTGKKKIEFAKAYIYGFVMTWAMMQIIVIPFIYLKVSFGTYGGILICVFVAMCLFAAVKTNTIMEYNPYTGAAYKSLPYRYVLSPFPSYIAFLSWFSGLSSAAITHTFLPGVLVILAYIVYYIIAKNYLKRTCSNKACSCYL